MHSHNPKKPIANIVIMGDSLSDRGTLNHSKLLGFIPMSIITHFAAKTHNNRFTNAETWDDDFGASIVAELAFKNLRKEDQEMFAGRGRHEQIVDEVEHNAELADMIEDHEGEEYEQMHEVIQLDKDKSIPFYSSKDFIRTYCQGGLTAHDWKQDKSDSVPDFASREILATLKDKRKDLIADDEKASRTKEEKAQTLVVEWSGGNDLITVNKEPTLDEARKAIEARIQNVRELIARGYRNFVLFELPDLSLTPRFGKKTAEEIEHAREVVEYFNTQLRNQCSDLLQDRAIKDAGVSLNVFGINKIMRDVHDHPKKYGFKNTTDPFVESEEYLHENAETSPLPSHGYMFWDDIHPTGHMHAILAEKFTERCMNRYDFINPPRAFVGPQDMVELFFERYDAKFKQDQRGLFGCFRRSRLRVDVGKSVLTSEGGDLDYTAVLAKILHHALHNNGHRTLSVLRRLGWVDERNIIDVENPELARAKDRMEDGQIFAQDSRPSI